MGKKKPTEESVGPLQCGMRMAEFGMGRREQAEDSARLVQHLGPRKTFLQHRTSHLLNQPGNQTGEELYEDETELAEPGADSTRSQSSQFSTEPSDAERAATEQKKRRATIWDTGETTGIRRGRIGPNVSIPSPPVRIHQARVVEEIKIKNKGIIGGVIGGQPVEVTSEFESPRVGSLSTDFTIRHALNHPGIDRETQETWRFE